MPDTYIVESKRSFLHDVTVGNRLLRLFSNGTVLYALRYRGSAAGQNGLPESPCSGAGPAVTGHEFWGQQGSCDHSLLMHFPLSWPLEVPVRDQDLPSQRCCALKLLRKLMGLGVTEEKPSQTGAWEEWKEDITTIKVVLIVGNHLLVQCHVVMTSVFNQEKYLSMKFTAGAHRKVHST